MKINRTEYVLIGDSRTCSVVEIFILLLYYIVLYRFWCCHTQEFLACTFVLNTDHQFCKCKNKYYKANNGIQFTHMRHSYSFSNPSNWSLWMFSKESWEHVIFIWNSSKFSVESKKNSSGNSWLILNFRLLE